MDGYKQAIHQAMLELAKDPLRRFVGYNVRCGRGGGTFDGIPFDQLVETPVAENLMAGVAIGLSLAGFKPLLYFERFDFILNALDAMVNHLDKIESMSDGQFKPSVLIRVVVGNRNKPLYTGPTHTQDFSGAMENLVSFPITYLQSPCDIPQAYLYTALRDRTEMLVEYKDIY